MAPKIFIEPPAFLGEDPSIPAEEKAKKRFSVKGKHAVITGGAGGLGVDSAFAMFEHELEGVLLIDQNDEGLNKAKDRLQKVYPNKKIVTRAVDVTSPEEVFAAAEFASQTLGSIDIVLSFAGVGGKTVKDEIESMSKIVDINLKGTYLVTRAFGNKMVKQGKGGAIVMAASLAGHEVCVPASPNAYGASKAAVLSMRMNFASEFGRYGIRVNSVSPSYMESPMISELKGTEFNKKWNQKSPFGRFGARGEICGPVLLLVSDAGSFINGSDIGIDGGMSPRL